MSNFDVFEHILGSKPLSFSASYPQSFSNQALARFALVCKDGDKATRAILRTRCIVFNPHDERFNSSVVTNMKQYRREIMERMTYQIKSGERGFTRGYHGNSALTTYFITDRAAQRKGQLQIDEIRAFGLKVRLFNFDTQVGTVVKKTGNNHVLYRAALDKELAFYPSHDTQGWYVTVDDGENAMYRLPGPAFSAMFRGLVNGAMYPIAQCE